MVSFIVSTVETWTFIMRGTAQLLSWLISQSVSQSASQPGSYLASQPVNVHIYIFDAIQMSHIKNLVKQKKIRESNGFGK
jgi:hypothetical protein